MSCNYWYCYEPFLSSTCSWNCCTNISVDLRSIHSSLNKGTLFTIIISPYQSSNHLHTTIAAGSHCIIYSNNEIFTQFLNGNICSPPPLYLFEYFNDVKNYSSFINELMNLFNISMLLNKFLLDDFDLMLLQKLLIFFVLIYLDR